VVQREVAHLALEPSAIHGHGACAGTTSVSAAAAPIRAVE
jgi:hypothetical protein